MSLPRLLEGVFISGVTTIVSNKSSYKPARRYASAVLTVIVCTSVGPCVTRRYCTKRLKIGSRKQRRTIGQRLKFSDSKNFGEIPTTSPSTGVPNRGGVGSNGDFRSISHYNSETVQERDIWNANRNSLCALSIDAISSDLE